MFHHILLLFQIPDYQVYISQFGYLGIYIWFITFDQITPFPEEISLMLLGYLVTLHLFNPILAGMTAIAGFMTIDVIYYQLSRTGNSLIKKRKRKSSRFIRTYRYRLYRNMARTMIILAFIPRIRLFVPIMIGSMKLSFRKFLLYDFISLFLFTGIYMLLGVIFRHSLAKLMGNVNSLTNVIFFGTLILIAATIVLMVKKKEKVLAKNKDTTKLESNTD